MSENGHRLLSDFVSEGSLKIQNGFPCGNWNDKGVGILHIRPFNISNGGQIDLGATKFVETDKKLGNYLLRKGDVIFNNTNSEERVGKTAYWDRDDRSVLSNHMTILRVLEEDVLEPQFLAFFLLEKWFARHFEAICRRHVNQASVNAERLGELELPPFEASEQKKIGHILSTVQRAIEAQERIIQTTTELKKALMHKLFTEGLRNGPQKQTEIGPVPKSWEVVRCEEACEKISVGIVVKPSSYYMPKGVPAFRSQNVREDRIQSEPMVYISKESNDGPVKKSKLSAGDVLIVRTGYPGTSCVVPPEYDGSNCIDLIFVRPDAARVRSHYLSRFFNSNAAKAQVQARKIGLAQQHFNVGAVKTTLMPLPSLDEQGEIVSSLELVDTKHNNAVTKRAALQDLFRALLHELMTAKTRVQDIALEM